jgi:hypothetical protein
MSRKIRRSVVVLAVTLVLLMIGVAPVYAETPSGEGPFDTMAPTGEWMKLEPGEYDWYSFHFDYDNSDDAVHKPIEIRMYAEPYAAATLTVRNQNQIDEWVRDGEHMHFGCCTMVDRDKNGDGLADYAEWAGTLGESGTYYIVVEHAKDVAGDAYYRFDISGENLAFPAAAQALTVEAAPTKVEAPAAALAPVALAELAGSAPDYALVPTGAWTELAPDAEHWYVFDFDYEKDIQAPVSIRLYNEPYEDVVLTVRNAEQADLWRRDGKAEHFGCCSLVDVDKDGDGKLDYAEWEGSLRSSGRYYIVVEPAEGVKTPTYYRFTLAGDNLSFPRLVEETAGLVAPVMEPKPAPEPVAMAAPTIDAVEPAGLMGTGPDFAMQPTGEWMQLEKGANHWYTFTYDDDADYTHPVTIRMFTNPSDAAILTVRNGEQAEAWRQDGENLHFGCCTPAKTSSGDQEGDKKVDEKDLAYAQWSADLSASGEYYIVIEHAKNVDEPGFYRFEISGDGVAY